MVTPLQHITPSVTITPLIDVDDISFDDKDDYNVVPIHLLYALPDKTTEEHKSQQRTIVKLPFATKIQEGNIYTYGNDKYGYVVLKMTSDVNEYNILQDKNIQALRKCSLDNYNVNFIKSKLIHTLDETVNNIRHTIYFIVTMKYDTDLSSHIKVHIIPKYACLQLLTNITYALTCIYKFGHCYTDLKPENIFIKYLTPFNYIISIGDLGSIVTCDKPVKNLSYTYPSIKSYQTGSFNTNENITWSLMVFFLLITSVTTTTTVTNTNTNKVEKVEELMANDISRYLGYVAIGTISDKVRIDDIKQTAEDEVNTNIDHVFSKYDKNYDKQFIEIIHYIIKSKFDIFQLYQYLLVVNQQFNDEVRQYTYDYDYPFIAYKTVIQETKQPILNKLRMMEYYNMLQKKKKILKKETTQLNNEEYKHSKSKQSKNNQGSLIRAVKEQQKNDNDINVSDSVYCTIL